MALGRQEKIVLDPRSSAQQAAASSPGWLDRWYRPEDRNFYLIMLAGVGFFFILTYPYRDMTLPRPLLLGGGISAMIGLLFVSWMYPQYYLASIAFCIYIPFSGAYEGDFGGLVTGFNATNVLLVPVILQWWMQRNYLGERLVRFHAPDIPLLIFCVLSTFSVLRVGITMGYGDFASELIRIKRWLQPFFVYFLFVNVSRNERAVRYMVIGICMTLTCAAILGMKESYDIGPGGTWDRVRIKGILGQANSIGAFFVYYTLIFLCLFLFYFRKLGIWSVIFHLIPFFICGRAMTLANSRGGIIAFTVATLATLLVRSRILFLIGLSIVIWGIDFPEYLPETISGRIFKTTIPPQSLNQSYGPRFEIEENFYSDSLKDIDRSASERMLIWRAGYQLWLDSPFFGHGYGSFPYLVGNYNSSVYMRDPHNGYLGIAAEMGGVALFFFLLTLLLILRSCFNVYYNAPDLFMRSIGLAGIGMLMGVFAANVFGSRLDTLELTGYLWIISAIIVQYDRELRERKRTVAQERRLDIEPWNDNSLVS